MKYPHLPPQTCSIKAHQRFQLLPWALFIVLISALSSLAVALSVINWFLPNIASDATLTFRGATNITSRVVLDPVLNRKIRQSLLTIYDTREKVNNSFYKESAYVGEAALLSSDGWAVLGEAGGPIASRRYWEAVDVQGTVYPIKKFVTDPVSGLTYFKIESEGFRVAAFYQWTGEEGGETLWSVGKDEWREIFLTEPATKPGSKEIFAIWKPQYVHGLLPLTSPGVIILSTAGELAGVVDPEGNLTPSWMIENQLSNLLAKGEIAYYGLSYQGYLVQGSLNKTELKTLAGFYITYSGTSVASSTVGVGDVIVKINNRPVEKTDLARQILLAPEEFAVTVLRDGAEIDIMVKKTKVVL
jgi:hypothetical protein